jgi:glycosyltransferase involved in cell wall biosynthesis
VKRTAVLVSRENFVWHSMQEIIPSLQQCWEASARGNVHEVTVIEIDRRPLAGYMPELLRADNVVFTSFTQRMSRLGEALRAKLGLEARFLFHVHNQATIAFWPLHRWGLAGVMNAGDVFISSCAWDARAIPLSFSNSRYEVVPFTFSEADPLAVPAFEEHAPEFVYVGRLSAQKNLDTLIEALSRIEGATLTLFGRADDLGSPNMGIRCEGLEERLRALAEKLGVQDRVRFPGHVGRDELNRYLSSRPHIFVSPSTHSDENFGMAAFRSLCMGAPAVLTRWGGHADFFAEFPEQVHFVEVNEGPSVSVESLAAEMKKAREEFRVFPARVPAAYTREAIAEKYLQLALTDRPDGRALEITDLARRILRNRERFDAQNDACRIFESYRDPAAIPFFRCYGMK